MRRIGLIGMLAACVSLAACGVANAPPPSGNATAPAANQNVIVKNGCAISADVMYGAEATYNVPAHAYVVADTTPALASKFAAVKPRAKAFLVAAYDALKKARLFYAMADSGFCGAVANVNANSEGANGLIPKLNKNLPVN